MAARGSASASAEQPAHRRPRAIALPLTRSVLSVPMLRVYQRALQARADGGLPRPRSLEILRTVTGYALAELLTSPIPVMRTPTWYGGRSWVFHACGGGPPPADAT